MHVDRSASNAETNTTQMKTYRVEIGTVNREGKRLCTAAQEFSGANAKRDAERSFARDQLDVSHSADDYVRIICAGQTLREWMGSGARERLV